MGRPLRGLGAGIGAALVLVSAELAPARAGERLIESERQRLERGELIVKTREREGYPWPEVTVYGQIAASAAEVMAVYADFEGQAEYLPGLVESRIVKRLSPNLFHVSYEYEVTGPNERYTVLAEVSRSPGGFRATWELVSARYARRLSGQVRVEAFGSGARVEYTNRVDRGFLGARLGSPDTTVRQLRETVQALGARVERLRVEQPDRLGELTRALQSMLGES